MTPELTQLSQGMSSTMSNLVFAYLLSGIGIFLIGCAFAYLSYWLGIFLKSKSKHLDALTADCQQGKRLIDDHPPAKTAMNDDSKYQPRM